MMRYAAVALACATATTGCRDDTSLVVVPRCLEDDDCPAGFVCEDGACVPADALSCLEVDGEQGILQPSPARIDFGFTGSGTSERRLRLRNIGRCTVTVFEARFAAADASPFECPSCGPERFPLDLFPFREHALTVFFTPQEVGPAEDALVLLSDDGELPEIRVPVRATFDGVPALAVSPTEVDFDFVPVGRTETRTVRLRNRGSGLAPLEIRRLAVETATTTAFSLATELDEGDAPLVLRPVTTGAEDSATVNVRYHPQEVDHHAATLAVYTNQPRNSVVRVPLTGSSRTPAKIAVAPKRVAFGPVPLGQTTARAITIVNEGGTPLRVRYRWTGTGLSTDLSALPSILPPIPPGRRTTLQVLVTATAPARIEGLLLLESNDPTRPTVAVQVSAEGQAVAGATVLKVDMTFDNGEDSALDDDFRNVDLALENPFGQVVDKRAPMPTDWNQFGRPTWFAFGPKEEPERIILPDAQQDGTYRVLLTYQEDCASAPSGLVAALLGISVEALITYLTGGSGVGVSAGQVSDVIETLCLSRTPSAATVTISINGAVVAEVPATLGRKGDFVYAADLVRRDGEFTVRP